MRKPCIASELTAAELSSAEYSVEDSERGDASTEFVMVGALLVLLTMAILQVSFALYARTMLVDAAAAGARYGTMRDRTPQEGMERTRQMIEGFFRLRMLRIFRTVRVVILRVCVLWR